MASLRHIEGNLFAFVPSATDQVRNCATAELLFQRGLEADMAGQADQALVLYSEAVKYNPCHTGALVNIGSLEVQLRNNTKLAEQYYFEALEIDPNYPLAHHNLAWCLEERGRTGEAINHSVKAVTLQPDYADAHYNLAIMYKKTGEWRKAKIHFQLYLRYGSGDDSGHRGVAKSEIRGFEERELCFMR